jgi:hypothetical protein
MPMANSNRTTAVRTLVLQIHTFHSAYLILTLTLTLRIPLRMRIPLRLTLTLVLRGWWVTVVEGCLSITLCGLSTNAYP